MPLYYSPLACDGALELGQLEARRFELMGPVADPLGDGGDSPYSAAGGVTATVDAGVHDRCVVAVAKAAVRRYENVCIW